jgi:hypothetical protein
LGVGSGEYEIGREVGEWMPVDGFVDALFGEVVVGCVSEDVAELWGDPARQVRHGSALGVRAGGELRRSEFAGLSAEGFVQRGPYRPRQSVVAGEDPGPCAAVGPFRCGQQVAVVEVAATLVVNRCGVGVEVARESVECLVDVEPQWVSP